MFSFQKSDGVTRLERSNPTKQPVTTALTLACPIAIDEQSIRFIDRRQELPVVRSLQLGNDIKNLDVRRTERDLCGGEPMECAGTIDEGN